MIIKTDIINSAISVVFIWLYYHSMMFFFQFNGWEFGWVFAVTATSMIVVMPVILVLGWEEIYSMYLRQIFLPEKSEKVV